MYPFASSSAGASPTTPVSNSTWGPSADRVDINVAYFVVVVVLASIVAFVLHASIRFLLLRFRRQQHYHPSPSSSSSSSSKHPYKIPSFSLADAAPASIYSPGATELAGGAECSICLNEFLDGDRVRVLPACNHGFHVKCVEKWLVSKPSCPTCRTSCRPTTLVTATPAEP